MVTLNGGADGITNSASIEKAAGVFVTTYVSTKGDYLTRVRAAADAANKFLKESAKQISTNEGDKLEVKQVN